jgi:CubicO group peptidase (beta-lactamase class C family)
MHVPSAAPRAVVGLALVLAPCAAPGGPRVEELSQTIRRLVEEHELPSLVGAAVRDGRIVWEDAVGWADRERQVPATQDTPYSLASITKPFTATAVMKLVEAKRVALDRPINDYLGEAGVTGPDADRATVRRVLSHTAGLPPLFQIFADRAPPPVQETITRHARLLTPPGRQYVYTNLGYGVLEHLIERVAGVSYEAFLRGEVFAPLGLERTFVARAAAPHAAVRYDQSGQPLPFYDLSHRGASSVYASARDLARFGMSHLRQQLEGSAPVLTRRSVEEMQRIQTPGSAVQGYGLGWEIYDSRPEVGHIGHTGGMPGVSTVLSLYPSERLVIVILTNKRTDAMAAIEREIVGSVMPRYLWRVRQLSGG